MLQHTSAETPRGSAEIVTLFHHLGFPESMTIMKVVAVVIRNRRIYGVYDGVDLL